MSSRVAVPGADTVLSDRYRLVRPLGSGGMGSVWEAEDLTLRRPVAVKVVHAAQSEDEVVLARFEREARTAARLSHPHLAMVFDYGEAPEGLYLVMELLQGETLGDRLRQGPLDHATAADVLAQTAEALAVAHAAGVVHRDVKPANLMLTDGGVKVMDFGIASGIGAALTATGLVIGTAAYLAPERVQGQAAGPPADVYALGAVLFECLTGTPAFGGDTPAEVAMGHVHREAPDLSTVDPTVPAHLVAACREALAKDPAARPTSAEFAGMLRRDNAQAAAPVPAAAPLAPTAAMAVPATAAPAPAPAPALPVEARAPATRSRRSPVAALLVLVVLLAALAGGAWALTRDDEPSGDTTATDATSAPTVAPPAATATTTAPTETTTAPATTDTSAATTVPAPAATSPDTLDDAAIAYLSLLDAGDFDAAWAATSPAFQASQDQASWRSFWGSFESVEVVGTPEVDEANRAVVVPLSFDGLREGYDLTFVEGPAGWLVDGPVGR